jgi:ABC-type transport system involved in cytochrome c biogenesis permease subunit
MHSLEHMIAEWRKTMVAAPNIGRETLDELENHLRETVDQLVRSGMIESDAFHQAVTQLGSPLTLAAEFQKLNQPTWLPVQVVSGIGIAAVVAMTVFLIHLEERRTSLLLDSHVFTLTLGYTATLLIGVLGICFVCQRCFSDFSPFRLESLARISFAFGCGAAFLTAVGIVLGMVWSRREWGRFWGWDPKEIGGLSIILWQIFYLFAHRLRRNSQRGVLGMSVLGNIIVILGSIGPNLLPGFHRYGAPGSSLFLLAAVASNFAFFLIGLAPAGWLRLSKA